MRSVGGDFTTRSKIRNAAIDLFGRHGFAHTTIRDVASYAQVSPALVIHHFASKNGLREACDRHILGVISQRAADQGEAASLQETLAEYLGNPGTFMTEMAYMRQAVLEDSTVGNAFFAALVSMAEEMLDSGMANGSIRKVADLRTTAVVLASNSMGMLVLGRQIARSLGHEEFNAGTLNTVGIPAIELYTHPLYTDERFLDAARAATDTLATTKER